MSKKVRVLLTTPDYPPKLGGLSTFTVNIEKVLLGLGIEVVLFNWSGISDVKSMANKLGRDDHHYDAIINIHYQAGYFLRGINVKHINFYHGSEILYYSSNPLKYLVKKILKSKMNKYIESTYLNLFISQFTMSKAKSLGVKLNYGRDIVINNGIDIDKNISKKISDIDNDIIEFICVARDVPHKNLVGCIELCEQISSIANKKVTLYLTSLNLITSSKINIINIHGIADPAREKLYLESHFNLLLSKDDSRRGFYEGFGLTVLESGKYGTPSIVLPSGGLNESVHHEKTGWHLANLSIPAITNLWRNMNKEHYESVSANCFSHTHSSHSLEIYQKLFNKVLPNL